MGLLRLFLALSVIAGHAETKVFGFYGIGGWYAVNFFFIISGFYMAMVLNEKYKNIKPMSFYKSRALRLFPTYYIGLIIALLVSFDGISRFFENLSLGAKFFYIFQNFFIFGQDLSYLFCAKTASLQCASPVGMTINPPAWSLAVELGFYLVAPFILRSEKKTFAFILFGCGYLLLLNKIDFPLNFVDYFQSLNISAFNYYFYPSSFIFFGGGALAYHLSKKKIEPHYFAAVIALFALSFTKTIMPFWHLLFISMAIPVLFKYTKKNRLDRAIGELSYPAYILHFPVLLFLRPFTQMHPQYFNIINLGSWVAIVSCLIGLLIYLVVEKKINIYRESKNFLEDEKGEGDKKNIYPLVLLLIFFSLPVAVIAYVYSPQTPWAPPQASSTSYNFTDKNWVNGIHRHMAGFFVTNSSQNMIQFQAGKQLKFSNGEAREIIRAEKSGPYLNIYITGDRLDGEKVGFPNKIEVIE